jgi:Asp-tRNA(Asn)/Glu-tRNA(Gln) amidotransferase A subunit family amidase
MQFILFFVKNSGGSLMDFGASSRRRFLGYFSGVGLSSTLFPGLLWSKMLDSDDPEVTLAMIRDASALSGLELTEDEAEALVEGVNRNLQGYSELREYKLENGVAPPIHFSTIVPGMQIDMVERPFRMSSYTDLERPNDLEEVAFWPLAKLAELVRSRKVSSLELTQMYLGRLKRYNPKFNNTVTFLDDLALQEARKADEEIEKGFYRGPLHGLPWGAKDILAVKNYPTTWGSNAFKGQKMDYEATVVTLLRDAGAVLIAKLTTGELASGDRWFGGRTRNPWNSNNGSSGSSAGSASATVAGCVAFAIGTETSGSILSPSVACGASGLRPTYGRVSRFGAMTLRWTGDRLGPICRTVEDCALVFKSIAKPDENDQSVLNIPFNWDMDLDATQFKVAYFQDAFADDSEKKSDWMANDKKSLEILEAVGVTLHPIDVPMKDFSTEPLRALSVESSAAFESFLLENRDDELTRPARASGWRVNQTVPAVAYLQAQRVRGIMMQELSDALGDFDVYVTPYGDSRTRLSVDPQPSDPPPTASPAPRRSATSHFFQLANHACYPAVAVCNGFGDDGLPTGIVFVGKPFSETKILAVAKAFQDAAGFYQRVPNLDG